MVNSVKKYIFSEVLQHWLLVLLFILLAITGFTQAKPLGDFSAVIIKIFGNLGNVIYAHRIFGIFYIFFFLIHLILIMTHIFRGNRGLLITKSDVLHPNQNDGSRFKLRHKLDYYAVIFGSFVLIATGFCLMFPEFGASLISGSGVSVMREIHFNEAIIATGVIIFWHLFYAHFHPEVIPVNAEIFVPSKRKV